MLQKVKQSSKPQEVRKSKIKNGSMEVHKLAWGAESKSFKKINIRGMGLYELSDGAGNTKATQ